MTHVMRKTSKLILTGLLSIGLMAPAYSAQATDSAHMQLANQKPAIPQKNESYVDTDLKNCSKPIESQAFVAVMGAASTDMNISCPKDKPVMYNWQLHLKIGPNVALPPFTAMANGGGHSSIICCPMNSHWVPSKQA